MDAYVQERRLDVRIAELAHRFHGVVDVAHLYALGASRTQIGHRIRSGRLIPLHRGVYAVGHRRLTRAGSWLAAVRAMGQGAALSHVHAVAHWDLRPPPGGRVHVTVGGKGRRQRKGILVHNADLPPEHVTVREEIPVTTPARTLADLAGTVSRPQLARAIEAADTHGLLDVPSLLAVSAGRPGAATLRALTRAESAPHPQRLRGRVPAPLRPLRHRPAADEHPAARLRGRRVLARPRLGRRARLLPVPRHPGRLRARPGARRRAPRRRADHPALHLRAGHEAPALGGVETRSTFSAWIFLIAPFLRAGGSDASAPRSASSSR